MAKGKKKAAKKAKAKLPLGVCMKTRGNRCFKLKKSAKTGRRVINSCTCTAKTPSKVSLKKKAK